MIFFGQPDILYITRNALIWYRRAGRKGIKVTIPDKIIKNEEVIDSNGYEEILKDFIKQVKIKRRNIIIAIAEEQLFYKEFHKGIPDLEEQARKFLAEIPISPEQTAKIRFDTKSTVWVAAANKNIYEPIVTAIQEVSGRVKTVVPMIGTFNQRQIIKILAKNSKYNFLIQSEAENKPKPNKNNNNPTTLILILLLVLSMAGMGYFLKTGNKPPPSNRSSSKITPTSTVVIPLSTPSIKPVAKELSILVLNGSGKKGTAGVAKDYLESLGYSRIETGNADKSNYGKTEISIKAGTHNEAEQIWKDISAKYETATPSGVLDESSKYDVEIIVGILVK